MKKSRKSRKTSADPESRPVPYSPRKKALFFSITLMIPVLLFVLVETGLHLFNLYPPPQLFVSTPDAASVYFGINTRIGERYFPKGTFCPTPRKDLFLKQKPDNSFRIFVLGGSTAAGFPYGNNMTFARILNRRLSDIFPERRVEVINMAMTAINSYTHLDYMGDILKAKPDALLIYAGHNEFYGGLGVGSVESAGRFRGIIRMYLKLQRFRTFMMLRHIVNRFRRQPVQGSSDNDPLKTIMSRIVQNKTIPSDSGLYKAAERQFRNNLNAIMKISKRAGVPVLISELVCNLRDQPPFIASEGNTLTPAGDRFVRARHLEKEKQYTEARGAYEEAKDLDPLRFRAPQDFNRIIHETAAAYDIPVVPMKTVFEEASPNGLIGNTLMADHLHPNKDGYFLMADAFYKSIHQEKWIQSDWPQGAKSSDDYNKTWGFTLLDSTYAALNILHLKAGWPFKKSGPNLALESFKAATKEDSIVLNIVKTGQATLEMGHIELAADFTRAGELDSAMKEYRALIYSVPHLDLFYEPAVTLLISMNQYQQALQILQEGLKYNTSFFMIKWTGQLHLVLNHTAEGIAFLEKACQLKADDEHVLFNLARAYYKTSQLEKGDSVFKRLNKIAPNSSLILQLNMFRKFPNN